MPVKPTPSGSLGITAGSVTPDDTRINRLMSENKEDVLSGLWDKFCGLFRPEKKAEVLRALRNVMYPSQSDASPAVPGSREESKGALDAFQALRALSDTPEVFVAKLTTERSRGECTVHMDFSIKGESVGKTEYFCPTGRVDLSGFDLRDADLREASLPDARLTGATLAGADLRYVNLSGADMLRANLRDVNLTGALLTDANLRWCGLMSAGLRYANLSGANMLRANLRDVNLTGALLTDADLTDANLSGANLTGADLTGARLADADLTGADLTDVDLTDASMHRANLRGIDLTGTRLTGADMSNISLTGALRNGVPLTKESFSMYFPDARNINAIRWQDEPVNVHMYVTD